MPDCLNAALSTSSRPLAAAADGSPLLTDDVPVDQDVSNPLMSLASGDAWPCGGHHTLGGEGGAAGDATMQDRSMPPHPTTTDVMLIDQNLIPRPPKQRQKGKKQANRNHGGHSKDHRRNYLNKPSGRPT